MLIDAANDAVCINPVQTDGLTGPAGNGHFHAELKAAQSPTGQLSHCTVCTT